MKKGLIILVTFLSIAVLLLGIYAFETTGALTSTSASLEGVYQRSLYELTNNVNNMEVEVSKLMVSNDSTSQQKILSNLKQQTSDAEASLSLLPLNSNTLAKTTQFMNQLNGYCTSLITYSSGKIEGEDLNALSQVHTSINAIKDELNSIMERIMSGYRITDNLSGGAEESNFSLNFDGFKNESINFPSLIYDGPFSDSTLQKTIKGLPESEITKEEAESKVQSILGSEITNLSYIGESAGHFVTYDFGASKGDKNYYLQITKRGGFLLSMSANVGDTKVDSEPSSEGTDVVESESISVEDIGSPRDQKSIQKAIDFARALGIENMQSVWSASSQNVCYVNLAPVEDGIVLYPDLIKAKVELSTGEVVGWEASSYAYNHVEREDLIPQLSENEALKKVSSNLSIDSTRLCVIPLDYVGETLAYEFSGKYDGYQYYLYIDAYTGNQARVLRVIQTDQGQLVM